MLNVFGKGTKWLLVVVGTLILADFFHTAAVVAILAILVAVQSKRLASAKALSEALADQVVEAQQGSGAGNLNALLDAHRQLGAQDAVFALMRDQADRPAKVRAQRA